MGLNVMFKAPADIASAVEWIGGEAAAVSAITKYGSYHGFSPNCRAAFADKCEELFPDHPRNQQMKNGEPIFKKVKVEDENGNIVEEQEPVLETEQDYLNRLLAAGVLTKEAANVIMQGVADLEDPKPKSRAGRKPSKKALTEAARLITSWTAGTSSFAAFKARWEELNATAYPFTDAPDSPENVARALLMNEDRKAREAANEFM